MIDGRHFSDFAGFTREFSRLLDDHTWNGGLDAFDDILHGGFGTPEDGWVLRWLNSGRSRVALGHEANARRLESRLRTSRGSHRVRLEGEIEQLRRSYGPTLFDQIVEIIRSHAPEKGGDAVVILDLA